MRYIRFGVIALNLLGVSALSQSNPPQIGQVASTQPDDSKLIQQIEDDWLQGERTTDIAVLDRILSDDYVNLTPRGLGPGKAEILEHSRTRPGQAPPYPVETHDMHVYIFDHTPVAAFTETYTAKENGNVMQEDNTHIFLKEHGVWKVRVSRASLLKTN